MNTALVFAGGTGQRMSSNAKPKQFLELYGKPIIIYTLEHFERHPEVERIVVVCLESWIEELKIQLERYKFRKVDAIVVGGEGGDKSIFNGLREMRKNCKDDDIVLIHDGVRPFINSNLISANIEKAKEYGVSITVEAATESIVKLENDCVSEVPPRHQMYVAKAPQTFKFGLIWDLYRKADEEGIRTIDSAHLCSTYDIKMHTVTSTPNNIKITMPQDFYIFRALLEALENQQILGL